VDLAGHFLLLRLCPIDGASMVDMTSVSCLHRILFLVTKATLAAVVAISTKLGSTSLKQVSSVISATLTPVVVDKLLSALQHALTQPAAG